MSITHFSARRFAFVALAAFIAFAGLAYTGDYYTDNCCRPTPVCCPVPPRVSYTVVGRNPHVSYLVPTMHGFVDVDNPSQVFNNPVDNYYHTYNADSYNVVDFASR